MSSFEKGFEKAAAVYKSMLEATKPAAQKLLSGSQFQAKQQALLAARKAAKSVPSPTPAAQKFMTSAGNAAKESVSELSAHAKNKMQSMNSRTAYSRAGLGVDRVN